MSTPATTTLAKPYSDPSATAASWDETRRALETAELFWVSTVLAGRAGWLAGPHAHRPPGRGLTAA